MHYIQNRPAYNHFGDKQDINLTNPKGKPKPKPPNPNRNSHT